jgi:hypothetical protein
MSLFFKKPQAEVKPSVVLRDFDALVADAVSFKLHGKIHVMNPVTVLEFWKFSESMAQIQLLATQEGVTIDSLTEGYLGIFQSVCPSITLEDVKNMTQPQIGALLQFVVDTIKGASQVEEYQAQKKNPPDSIL